MIVEGNRAVTDMLLQKLLASLEFLERNLPEPLEGCVWLWYKAGDGDRDLDAAPSLDFLIQIDDFLCKICNADDVFVRLRREPHHEVKLDLPPALTKCRAAGLEEIFLRDTLIDDVAHALCAGFRCKGKSRLSDLLHFVCKIDGKAVDAQRWQRKTDLFS